jgi:hypothetical protein
LPRVDWGVQLWEFYAALGGTFSSPAYSDSKLFLPINPLRTFLFYDKAFALQKQMKSSTTKSLSLLGKLFHPLAKSVAGGLSLRYALSIRNSQLL